MTQRVWTMSGVLALTLGFATLATQQQVQAQAAPSGPMAESASKADSAINQALLVNDAAALEALTADDWTVVSGLGDVVDRAGFIGFIRQGVFKRKTMILSEPRVRLYGTTALVTTHLSGSGFYAKKPGTCTDFTERQTDVLVLKNGGWKSVLLHETLISRHSFAC